MKDANSSSTILGIDNVTGGIVPIQIDPVTGKILIYVEIVNDLGGSPSPTRALKDSNSTSTLIATGDDGNIYIPTVDNRNNYLYLNLINA